MLFGSRYEGVLEKEMAAHSSVLAWKIAWRQAIVHRITKSWTVECTHWRRKWQPTPVFLPGESQGLGSLVGCRLWGRTELDTTEAT